MTVGLFLAVACGGLVGAPARYLLDRFVSGRIGSDLPWGTFVINVSGSFILGVLIGLSLAHHLSPVPEALLGTGFCGAYTTFSTFAFESVRLIEAGRFLEAAGYLATSLVVGLVAAGAGVALGLAL